MNESFKKIIDSFHCKYTVFEKGTDPDIVEQAYKAAFQAGKAGGFYPAIVVLEEYGMEWLKYAVQGDYDRESVIDGCGDNGQDILRERFEEYTEEDELRDYIGEETEGDELHHFCGYVSFREEVLVQDTLLLEIPVKNPWEIVGYLPMGGWNECPGPEDMIAICKYWYEKYKAVPAVFAGDVMEFYAPLGLNGVDSIEAAKEHYAFCMDRVDQGTRTYKLSELAAGLAGSDVWYFWWD